MNNASSWIEIDAQALLSNIAQFKKLAPHARFAPVIKGNAYGHGIVEVARLLQSSNHVDLLCVVSVSEALLLRKKGISKPLLVLSIIDGSLMQAIQKDIELVVYNYEIAVEINRVAQQLNKKAKVHIKIDTGLSRLGILADDAVKIVTAIAALRFLSLQAIFSHLANSEEDIAFARYQIDLCKYIQQQLPIKTIHISCSAALWTLPESHTDLVRLGIGIYGLWPSQEIKKKVQQQHPSFDLKPVLTWKTRIIQIKTVRKGTSIGYGRTHIVMQDTTIAVLPIGYWDGYDRGLSQKSFVTINGHSAPVVGRVAMNMCMIDITGLSVTEADQVILLGGTGITSADNLAEICNTINYEIVTRINPLLLRRVVP